MKTRIVKLLSLAIVIFAFTANTFAQVTASATGTAVIITPIAINKTVDMNFGNVAVSTALGTVVLDPAGTRTRTGGVTLPVVAGTVTAASFDITGAGTSTYSITLPSTNYIITRLTGSETMIVNTFTSNPSGTGALTAGAQTLLVGATLNVGGSQVAGTYTNAVGFDVTVNYN